MDNRTNYDFALKAIRSGNTPEERRQAIIAELIREHPGMRESDLTISVTDAVIAESVRIVTRPATEEELAQLKIAENIGKAEDAFTERLVPRYP